MLHDWSPVLALKFLLVQMYKCIVICDMVVIAISYITAALPSCQFFQVANGIAEEKIPKKAFVSYNTVKLLLVKRLIGHI